MVAAPDTPGPYADQKTGGKENGRQGGAKQCVSFFKSRGMFTRGGGAGYEGQLSRGQPPRGKENEGRREGPRESDTVQGTVPT